jgi:hypothetical protein
MSFRRIARTGHGDRRSTVLLRVFGPDNPRSYPRYATLLALVLLVLAQTVNVLAIERHNLAGLVAKLDEPAADHNSISREFQAFVLHLETMLTAELLTWIIIAERDEFEKMSERAFPLVGAW